MHFSACEDKLRLSQVLSEARRQQRVLAIHSTPADSAHTAAPASLLLQSTFQAMAVKTLRDILHPALLLHPQLFSQSLYKQEHEDPRTYLKPKTIYSLGNTVVRILKTGKKRKEYVQCCLRA